jgi:hypothetical protein
VQDVDAEAPARARRPRTTATAAIDAEKPAGQGFIPLKHIAALIERAVRTGGELVRAGIRSAN